MIILLPLPYYIKNTFLMQGNPGPPGIQGTPGENGTAGMTGLPGKQVNNNCSHIS